MITYKMIEAHAKKYPAFDRDSFVNWMKSCPSRWGKYDSVAVANKDRKKSNKLKRLARKD